MIGRLYVWRGMVWLLEVRGEPFDRGPRRNVLLRRVERRMPGEVQVSDYVIDGVGWYAMRERVVRPFRGLRRWRP